MDKPHEDRYIQLLFKLLSRKIVKNLTKVFGLHRRVTHLAYSEFVCPLCHLQRDNDSNVSL